MSIPEKYPLPDYTDSDLKYPEHKDNRRVNRLIREQIEGLPWRIIRAFEEAFPCPKPRYYIEVLPAEYIKEYAEIADKIKNGCKLDKKQTFFVEHYTPECVYIHSLDDFLDRWNRFKKLKAFL